VMLTGEADLEGGRALHLRGGTRRAPNAFGPPRCAATVSSACRPPRPL
jgi:hypothetical protein